jgi:hypothetical protein
MTCELRARRSEASDPAMEHHPTITQLGEGALQVVCGCGWRSEVFGAEKTAGTMDSLQQATEAADLHEWDADLS